MAKFRCRCGHEMRLTGADSPYEFSLIPEAAVVNISDQLESGNVSSENFFDEIDKLRTDERYLDSSYQVVLDELVEYGNKLKIKYA